MNSLLQTIGLKKNYFDGPRVLEVLKGVELEVFPGQTIAIMGASGVGKTTLLHLLGALDKGTEGEIVFAGQPYSTLKMNQLAELRNKKIGFIFQFHNLLPEFTALENVIIPAMINGMDKEPAKARGLELLRRVGLSQRVTHRPSRLSGGERQRVALARALVNEPELVLADEPTGDLDLKTGDEMLKLIWAEITGQRKSLVIATHNPDIANRCSRIFQLYEGVLHETATTTGP